MSISKALMSAVGLAEKAVGRFAKELPVQLTSSATTGGIIYFALINGKLVYPVFPRFDPEKNPHEQTKRWACTLVFTDLACRCKMGCKLSNGGALPLPDHGTIREYPCGCKASSLLVDDLEQKEIRSHLKAIASQLKIITLQVA